MKTDSFKTQHKEIADLVGQVEKMLDPASVTVKADEIRTLLVTLSGKLSVHLAMEDKVLYPAMINSSNATAKSTAEKFATEMGTIGGVFKGYTDKWKTGAAIKADAAGFITDTKGLFTALKDRVVREERDLYTLAEQV